METRSKRKKTPVETNTKPKHTTKDTKTDETQIKEVVQKPAREPDDLDIAIQNYRKFQEEHKKIDLKEIQDLKKKFKLTVQNTKRETQALEQARAKKTKAGRTRSGKNRLVLEEGVHTDGKWVNKGMDDAVEKYDQDELDYLKRNIEKVNEVKKLDFPQLKYLVVDVFLDELKSIKEGKFESEFHKRYEESRGKSKADLLSEVRTNLFTNDQRDYISGLLQGAFDTTSKDANGGIKHSEINYVVIVMLAEITIRIVKYVHKFKSNEEAFKFMVKSSREAFGLGDDDDDD